MGKQYTQQHAAHKLKLTSSSVLSRWEKGATRPTLEDLLKLSLLYDTTVDNLYIDLKKTISEKMQLEFSECDSP